MSRRRLIVEADGGSRGNPGPAAYGTVVLDGRTGEVLVELADHLGTATNNVAEYEGVTAGLLAAREIDPDALVEARLDSRLVVEQMSGGWSIKNARLRELALRARAIWPVDQVRFTWVPRERNKRADALANRSLDAVEAGRPGRIEVWHRGTGDADVYVNVAEQLVAGPEPADPIAGVAGVRAEAAAQSGADAVRAAVRAARADEPVPTLSDVLFTEDVPEASSSATGERALSAPAGSASAGSAPAGSAPAGSASAGSAPAGSAPAMTAPAISGPGISFPTAVTSTPAPEAPVPSVPTAGAPPADRRIVGWSRADLGAPTTLVLVRHGVTQHSVEHRFSGRNGRDPALIELGERQAEAAAEELARRGGADVLVSSPLRRTRQTAAIIAERLGLGEPLVVDGLAEADFGDWDALTFAEVREKWPNELAAWLASFEVAPPGGESFASVRRRVEDARLELLARFPGQRVLAVAHVTPIKVLVQQVLDAPASSSYRFELAPCSLTTLSWWADGVSTVYGMGEHGHLHGVMHETA